MTERPRPQILCANRRIDGSAVSTYFPAANAQQELQDIALLLLLKLLDVCMSVFSSVWMFSTALEEKR